MGDYFQDGSFVNGGSFPSIAQVESFSSNQLAARLVNSGWSTQKIYITRTETDNPNDKSGPNQGRYYSPEEKAVYYLYRYQEDGNIKGHVEQPWGLDKLRGAPYFITGEDIVKASVGAWRFAPTNYTYDQGIRQVIEMAISNQAVSPFKEGAGFSGTFTIPVCDTGKRNFNSQWTSPSKRVVSTGKLPCCCGPNYFTCVMQNAVQGYLEGP
ncbi:hypothetical protein P152DRAFT_106160 [Eremomyces bilateralis CBS 781.70]|uniref:Uncharacterized protein n=1 Tax=Eremomyces bilateralis CBS 781.70 TaxID=1392243 RepID=A0A6G1FXA9_9PEZI|nr:uncharacterized protein P152DRAFT_106160 [Eremomyces bilateralis CBS 781.70]KAF1810259.1 hypothetical protein P152DRAFT_106160 [Eremomyces bilateralis CBS 781.70]